MPSPILEPLELTDDERSALERWARRPTSAQALALRCRIVLACATGQSNTAVAKELGVRFGTVSKWRSRFVALRLDGLHDEPRPGAPRLLGDDAVEAVVVKTLEETPTDATHWSTRSMAKATGMSQSAVSRIWRAFGLKPHLVDTFKLSPDPLFVEKVRDVVGLYINPPDSALVLCVDEKTQIGVSEPASASSPLRLSTSRPPGLGGSDATKAAQKAGVRAPQRAGCATSRGWGPRRGPVVWPGCRRSPARWVLHRRPCPRPIRGRGLSATPQCCDPLPTGGFEGTRGLNFSRR